MDQIKFGTLKFKNFRCHTEEAELDFPVDQLVAITGRNGRGKSSYFMAFQVALYGKTAEGIELADLVNRRAGKNLEVHIPFTVTNDKNEVTSYQIDRYYQHKKYHNKLLLMKDGIDISGKTTTDTYKIIESIIIPRNVFLNTVYFSQQVKDFFTALTDAKQKEIFEAILQLEEWETYYKSASLAVKQKEVDIYTIEDRRNHINVRIPAKEEEIQRIQEEYDDKAKTVKNQLTQLSCEIQQLETQILELTATGSTLVDLRLEMDTLVNTLAQKTADARVLQLKRDEVKTQFEERKQSAIQAIDLEFKESIQTLKEEIEAEAIEIKKQYTDQLPELTEALTNLRVEASKRESELNQEFINIQRKYDVPTLQTERDNELSKLSTEKSTLEKTFTSLKDQYDSMRNDLIDLKAVIDSMSGTEKICPTCNQGVHDADAVAHFDAEKSAKVKLFTDKKLALTKVMDEFKLLKQKHGEVSVQYDEGVVLYESKLQTMALAKQSEMEDHTIKSDALLKQDDEQTSNYTKQIDSINVEMDKQLQVYRDRFSTEKENVTQIRSAKFSELNKTVAERQEKEILSIQSEISLYLEATQILTIQKQELLIKVDAAQIASTAIAEKTVLVEEKKNQHKQLSEIVFDETIIEAKKQELIDIKAEVETDEYRYYIQWERRRYPGETGVYAECNNGDEIRQRDFLAFQSV